MTELGQPIPGQQCLTYQDGKAIFMVWDGKEWASEVLGPMSLEEFELFVEQFPNLYNR